MISSGKDAKKEKQLCEHRDTGDIGKMYIGEKVKNLLILLH